MYFLSDLLIFITRPQNKKGKKKKRSMPPVHLLNLPASVPRCVSLARRSTSWMERGVTQRREIKSWGPARTRGTGEGFKPEHWVLLGFILHFPISCCCCCKKTQTSTVTALAPRPLLSPGTPLHVSRVLRGCTGTVSTGGGGWEGDWSRED